MLRLVKVRFPETGQAHLEVLCEALRTEGFSGLHVPLSVLRQLPRQVRNSDELSFAVVEGPDESVVVDASPGPPLCLAVDVGSTNLDAWLYDPIDGKVLAEAGVLNPQSCFSEDILDRVLHSGNRMHELQPPLVHAINELAHKLSGTSGRSTSDIYLLCVAGNTAMMHLLLGVEATGLPTAPNTPAFHSSGLYSAREAGFLLHPEARVYTFPNVGAFVGGDVLADLLAVGIHRQEKVSLLVDVGTNAEVLIGNRHWLLAGAGAAGPALEGGVAKHAGRARPGAVDRCRFDHSSGQFDCSVIGNIRPTHFCGSGLIELIAELYKEGLIDGRGRFREGSMELISTETGDRALKVLIHSGERNTTQLLITEHDIENFIRSKAGMYALIQTLLSHTGIEPSEISTVHVCGAFGNRISAETATFLGMVPPLPDARFLATENATLKGIVALVRNANLLRELAELGKKITYIDMNTDPVFMQHFAAARFIPHTDTLE